MKILHEYRPERRERLPVAVIIGIIIGVFFCFALGGALGLLGAGLPQ